MRNSEVNIKGMNELLKFYLQKHEAIEAQGQKSR